jgi:S1-C subfamily serine protease
MGLDLGYREQAETYFDQVLGRVPGHPQALLGKAKACQDPQIALETVRTLLHSRPASLEARRLKENLLAKLESAKDAEHALTTMSSAESPPTKQELDLLRSSRQAARQTLSSEPSLAIGKPPSDGQSSQAQRPSLVKLALLLLCPLGLIRDRRIRRLVSLAYVASSLIVLLITARVLLSTSLFGINEVNAILTPEMLSSTIESPAAASTILTSASSRSLLRKAELATVLVIVPDPDSGTISRGSGTIVTLDGLVLTNYHVLASAGGMLSNSDGLAFIGRTSDVRQPPSEWYIAALVAADDERDLAVLRIVYTAEGSSAKGMQFQEITPGDSNSLALGQTLMGLGYPDLGGDTLTLTKGSMAGFAFDENDVRLGKTDSELLPGSSGGAVLDEEGLLVGVITAAYTDSRTQGRLSYFVLFDEAESVIQRAKRAPRPRPKTRWMVDLFQ